MQLPASASSVTVHGILNPGREGAPGTFELGRYEFLYSKTSNKTGCRGEGKAPVSPGISLGGGKEGVSETLSGLVAGTEYAVCLVVGNEFKEEAVSLEALFRTESPPETPEASGLKAEPVSGTSEVLRGVLNSKQAGEVGGYEFAYRASSGECQGEGEEKTGGEAHGALEEAVSNEVGGLRPNTQYAVCLLARNEAGETAISSPVTFTTFSQKPSVAQESVVRIGTTSATVSAQVEPGGIETTYSVQYGTTIAYGSETTPVKIDGTASTVTVSLGELQPSTEYHFRFVATNGDGKTTGNDVTFTSYPAGSSSGLPDGRVYEMISPPENQDADIYEPLDAGSVEAIPNEDGGDGLYSNAPFQASADGGAVEYVGAPTIGGNGSSGDELGNEYLASRSQGGWKQTNITPKASRNITQYQGFSSELSVGFIQIATIPPFVASEAPYTLETRTQYPVLYSRAFDEGDYRPLFTVTPPYRSVEEFGTAGLILPQNPKGVTPIENQEFGSPGSIGSGNLVYAGSSANSSHVLFEANDALLQGEGKLEKELSDDVQGEVKEADVAAKLLEEVKILRGEGKDEEAEVLEERAKLIRAANDHDELYDSVGGKLNLVNIVDGSLSPGASFGGSFSEHSPPNFWEHSLPSFSHAISADGSRIFWTDTNNGVVYVRLDGSSTVQVSQGAAQFWTASTNGGYAFYTEAGKLWRFDLEDRTRVELAGSSGGVQGVVGTNAAGEEGAYLYFIAQEALPSGDNGAKQSPVAGEDNLYVDEPDSEHSGESKISFIGTLSSEDSNDWSFTLGQRSSNLTPDGHGLVFASHRNLTGRSYPGEGSDEVYVYDAHDPSLFCVSCRPQASGGHLTRTFNSTYVYRWMSEDGNRVFFDSKAPLVAQDVNGVQDVYEWERDGTGACQETNGCVYLISNGFEGSASFVDASTSANDVFFVTRERLVPVDGNESVDLYDARVGGVLSVAPPECSGTGCQGAPAPAPVFATPSSVTFAGVGNFPPEVNLPRTTKKAKHLTRPQKLSKALKACHKKREGRLRAACEVKAHKLYGVKVVGGSAKRGVK